MKRVKSISRFIPSILVLGGLIYLIVWKANNDDPHYPHVDPNNPIDIDQESVYDGNCGVKNGNHSAKVYYINLKTSHIAIYTLDVDVEDCKVIKIHFPKGGTLSDKHFENGDLDQFGKATLSGERDVTYGVEIKD